MSSNLERFTRLRNTVKTEDFMVILMDTYEKSLQSSTTDDIEHESLESVFNDVPTIEDLPIKAKTKKDVK